MTLSCTCSQPELPMLLGGSTRPLVTCLFDLAEPNATATDAGPAEVPAGDASAAPRGRRGKKSERIRGRGVAGSFGRQLDSLLAMLGQTTPHYVSELLLTT